MSTLKISFVAHEKVSSIPDITEGMAPGSVTDFTNPNAEVVLFGVDPDGKGAYIAISEIGVTEDIGPLHPDGTQVQILSSAKLRKEKTLLWGESYTKKIKSRYGEVNMVFTFNK